MAYQTGQIKSFDDIPDGAFIKYLPRFQPDVFDENMKLVKQVEDMAAKKGATASQIALGWVQAHNGKKGLPQILPIPGATTTERIEQNMKPAELSEEDMETLAEILKKFPVQGERYMAAAMHHVEA
jgi:pyridoxine 4-dehydrogenase